MAEGRFEYLRKALDGEPLEYILDQVKNSYEPREVVAFAYATHTGRGLHTHTLILTEKGMAESAKEEHAQKFRDFFRSRLNADATRTRTWPEAKGDILRLESQYRDAHKDLVSFYSGGERKVVIVSSREAEYAYD